MLSWNPHEVLLFFFPEGVLLVGAPSGRSSPQEAHPPPSSPATSQQTPSELLQSLLCERAEQAPEGAAGDDLGFHHTRWRKFHTQAAWTPNFCGNFIKTTLLWLAYSYVTLHRTQLWTKMELEREAKLVENCSYSGSPPSATRRYKAKEESKVGGKNPIHKTRTTLPVTSLHYLLIEWGRQSQK